MKRYSLKIKEIELQLHEGNYNRRVQYNEKDFDILVVSFKEKADLYKKNLQSLQVVYQIVIPFI